MNPTNVLGFSRIRRLRSAWLLVFGSGRTIAYRALWIADKLHISQVMWAVARATRMIEHAAWRRAARAAL